MPGAVGGHSEQDRPSRRLEISGEKVTRDTDSMSQGETSYVLLEGSLCLPSII